MESGSCNFSSPKKSQIQKNILMLFIQNPVLKKNKNKKQLHKGEGCTEKPRIGGGGLPGQFAQ